MLPDLNVLFSFILFHVSSIGSLQYVSLCQAAAPFTYAKTIPRFCLWRIAIRGLSNPSRLPAQCKPRSIVTLTSAFSRTPTQICISSLQRGFASSELKDAEQEDTEAPQAPETTSAEAFDVADVQETRSAEAQEPASDREEPSTIASTISSAAESASSKASEAAETVTTASRSALDSVSRVAKGGAAEDATSADSIIQEYPSPRNQVYVGNLFFDVTEADLTREMSRFGTVKSVKIIYDARGLSKGQVFDMRCFRGIC